mgnify:CR=1 FL=1
MPFGYLGTTPNQQLKNSGVFSVEEALAVKNNGEWGGSLELIEEQTISSGQVMDFTSIKENKYDVHLLDIKCIGGSGASSTNTFIRFYESGVLESASVYQYAFQYGFASGTFGEGKSTSATGLPTGTEVFSNANDSSGSYAYFYNLGNSSKYSFMTMQGTQLVAGGYRTRFGGGVLPQASTVDGIRLYSVNSIDYTSLTAKLYGVKQLWVL